MNPYNFSVLFFAFGTLFVGTSILLKQRDRVAVSFIVFSVFVVFWGIGYSLLVSETSSYKFALFVSRISNASAVFISITWIHFVFVFLNIDAQRKKLLLFLYSVGFCIVAFSFSRWFIPFVSPNEDLGFNWYTKPGPIFMIFTLFFFSTVPYGFFEMMRALKNVSGENLIQLKALIFATFFGFVGGSFTFLPVYGISIPQYGIFLMPLYPLIMAYAMIRHRLFDIEQIAQAFQREKLATIGLLAASVNHEIRNPLYAAQGLLETYLESKREGIGQKDPEIVSEKALNQIRRALDVITKLNRFAKPVSETNVQDLKASIQVAIQTVLDLVSYEFELDKIKIVNQIDSSFPFIRADQRQLEEILFNLIVNACYVMSATQRSSAAPQAKKADPSFGGKEGVLEIKGMKDEGRVRIEIKDTGTGISSEQAKHLFEPFHTTKGEKGTGLGLYITKQLVERNGGKIMVESKEGQGTIFKLEFKAL